MPMSRQKEARSWSYALVLFRMTSALLLFRMTLRVVYSVVRHGSEALVYINHPREAAASSYLAIIFTQIASEIPWFLRSTADPVSVQALV